jgi:hypothetical protein
MSEMEHQPKAEYTRVPLAEAHELLFDDSHITLGHGTSPDSAAKILENGLVASQPRIDMAAMGLSNDQAGWDLIKNWPHREARAVVILMPPSTDLGRSTGPGISADQHIWEELPKAREGDGDSYRFPSKLIRGFIDVGTDEFVVNPAYEAEPLLPPPVHHEPHIDDDDPLPGWRHATPDSSPESTGGVAEDMLPTKPDDEDAPGVW